MPSVKTALVRATAATETPATELISFRPLDGLTVEELLAEFRQLLGFSTAVVARAAAVYLELQRHGVKVDIPGVLFQQWLPKVAAGLVAAEAVAAFNDRPSLLQNVAKLPPAEQRRVAVEPVMVVPAVGKPAVPMSVRVAYDQGLKSVVVAGKILPPELQELQMVNRPAPKAVPAADKKPIGKPAKSKVKPANEAEVEALAERFEKELLARGNARPTAKWISECVAMFGWVPKDRTG